MSQEKSKMPVSRQIRYLRGSRDNWKQNAAKKQRKIREYEQTIRSWKISRDNWKTRAKEAEKRVLVNWAIDLLNSPLNICHQLLPSMDRKKLEKRLKVSPQ